MTCMKRTSAWGAVLAAALLSGGCDGDPAKVVLSLLSPAADATLTMADDEDSGSPGLQLDVLGESEGLSRGTAVNLLIDGESADEEGRIDADGDVSIRDVTLPPGVHELQLRTSTGSAVSAIQTYTLRVLEITSPQNRAELTGLDDLDADTPGVQIDVTADSWAIDADAQVELLLDGEVVDSASPDEDGELRFDGVTLSDGEHVLQLRSGEGDALVESDEVEIDVQGACAQVNFITPEPPADGALTLGGGACPDADEPFALDVEISTDAGNGRPIALFVNDVMVQSGEVEGSAATFRGIELPVREAASTLSVEVENADGVTCRVDYPSEIRVDCAGPGCTLVSPTPLEVGSTSYVNAAMRGSAGFDFDVRTGDQGVGQAVSLIIDGRVRDARMTDAESVDAGGRARFDGVDLSDGNHTIEAQCTDAAGNVSSTGELTWMIDTTPCAVNIEDPVAGELLIEADDEVGSGNAADDIQVVATSIVTGGDCTGRRAAVCDPDEGIASGSFVAYDGSNPLLSTITLDPGAISQSLCIEIEDAAGNVGRGSVGVLFRDRDDAPAVQFATPVDGDDYNALGGGGYLADASRTSANLCDGVFKIACTEIGVPVDVRPDSASSAVQASADCEEPAAGDPPPTGFAGWATVDWFFGEDDDSADVVATQTIEAASGQLLTGASEVITLGTDCELPGLTIIGSCASSQGNQLSVTQAGAWDFRVLDNTMDLTSAELRITRGATTTPYAPDTFAANEARWNDVDLGGEGEVEIEIVGTDDFGNVASSSCPTLTIVPDLPEIVSWTSPAADAVFGPGQQSCTPSNGDEYGVSFSAQLDVGAARDVTLLVDGVDYSSRLTLAPDGTLSGCIPVPDDAANPLGAGPSTLALTVDSTISVGQASASRSVSVSKLAITAPTADQEITSDACAGSGIGTPVTFTADASLDGATVTLRSTNDVGDHSRDEVGISVGGASQSIVSGCLVLADAVAEQGPNAITAEVGGDVLDSVDVFVVYAPPSGGIPIVLNPVAPADLDDQDHRSGPMVTWPQPSTDYPDQLRDYELRCRSTALTGDAETWWNAATVVDLGSVTPQDPGPTHSARPAFRPEQRQHCVLRAADINGDLTPIDSSTNLTLKLRAALLSQGQSGGNILNGYSIGALGSIDGDAYDDLLIGGDGSAHLIFGSPDGPSGTPDVTFRLSRRGFNIGQRGVGIGDFNDDGLPDFAIGDWGWFGDLGRINVFFGRPQGEWPSAMDQPIDLTGAACNADLCIEAIATTPYLAFSMAPAGDFDGDGFTDLVAGSPFASSTAGEVLVLLGGAYEARSCASDGDCRATVESCNLSSLQCELVSDTFWGMTFEYPSGDWVDAPGGPVGTLEGFRIVASDFQAGFAVVGMGELDSGGDDIVYSLSEVGEVMLLNGRSWTGPARFQALDEVTDVTKIIDRGAVWGAKLAAVGDVYDLPGAVLTDQRDLAGSAAVSDTASLYLGDVGPEAGDVPFDSDYEVAFSGPGTNIAEHTATGYHAGLDVELADVDGDGNADLCMGTRLSDEIFLWYHDVLATEAADLAVPHTSSIRLSATEIYSRLGSVAPSDTAELNPQYVGDFNGDGALDIAVGNWRVDVDTGDGMSERNGQTILLY